MSIPHTSMRNFRKPHLERLRFTESVYGLIIKQVGPDRLRGATPTHFFEMRPDRRYYVTMAGSSDLEQLHPLHLAKAYGCAALSIIERDGGLIGIAFVDWEGFGTMLTLAEAAADGAVPLLAHLERMGEVRLLVPFPVGPQVSERLQR